MSAFPALNASLNAASGILILIGYSFLIPQKSVFNMMLVLCVLSAFMFHTFLMLAATDEFKVSFSRFGPTELRIALIVINALLVKFGTRGLRGALPWVAFGGVIALSILAYIAQVPIHLGALAVGQEAAVIRAEQACFRTALG